MGRRPVKMVCIIVCLMTVLCFVPGTDGQTMPQLTPIEKQAVLVFHRLLKESPGLASTVEKLLKASNQSDTVVASLTAGITENPLTVYLIQSLMQGLNQLQNQSFNSTGNQPSNRPEANGTLAKVNGSSPEVPFQNFANSLQSKILTTLTQGLIQQVTKAISNNPSILANGQLNTSLLLSSVDPASLLQATVAQLGSVSSLLPYNGTLLSRSCYNDMVDTIDSAVARKGWAIEMVDALGKPTAGVERGSFYFTGSYDQCYMIKPTIQKGEQIGYRTAARSKAFGTRFCRADFNIDSFVNSLDVDTRGYHIKLIWGMCVPDSCHKDDMKNIFKLGLLDQTNLPVESVYCEEDDQISRDPSAIVAIVVLAFFGLLVVTGTLYDICKPPKKPASKPRETGGTTTAEGNSSALEIKDTNLNGASTSYDAANVSLPPGYVPHREGDGIYEIISNTSNGKPQVSNQTPAVVTARDPESQTAPSGRTPKDPLLDRLLLCFSAYTNIPRLLHAKQGTGAIGCIHGIRFLSLTWVVLGHTYNYGIISIQETFTAGNLLDFASVIQRFSYQAVIAGGYAVDTFFVLSAFLMTWLQLKETSKRKNKLSAGDAFMFYFHRFWRLTPIYMIVLMTFTCLYDYVISGPFAPSVIEQAENCKSSWWTNLLYINNLAEVDKQCLGWSWYLANDMQFYVISPIFLILMYIKPVAGALLTGALLVLGIGLAFWKEWVYNGNFFAMLSDGGEWWQNVYTVPWCRVHCWAIGMLLGFIVYKRGNKPLQSKILNRLGWVLATGVALFLVYIPHTENKEGGTKWTSTEHAFYESFGRAAWGTCIAWVIFACYTGRGGIVNSILSWNGFIPLSRLTYATYLLHPICMMIYVFNRRTLLYVDDYNIIYLFIGHLVVSNMVAFVFSLTFEAPFMQLEKVLLRTGNRR